MYPDYPATQSKSCFWAMKKFKIYNFEFQKKISVIDFPRQFF